MRLFTTYSHTSTLRGYEASGEKLQRKTTNEERKTGKRLQSTPAKGGIDRRESYDVRRIARGKGARENGKRELCRKREKKKKKKRNNCYYLLLLPCCYCTTVNYCTTANYCTTVTAVTERGCRARGEKIRRVDASAR